MLRALVLAAAPCALLTAAFLDASVPERAVDAGTVLRLEIEDLVFEAELVLEGRVIALHALTTANGRVATEFELEVERTFLGEPLARRTLRIPGGTLPDGSGVLIAGMPRMSLGEDVILFLSEVNGQGARMPVGLAQGKLRVATTLAGEKVLLSRHDGLDWAHAPGAALRHAQASEHLDYPETLARIHAAVQGKLREPR